jgi:hypothetical protein
VGIAGAVVIVEMDMQGFPCSFGDSRLKKFPMPKTSHDFRAGTVLVFFG